MSGDNEGPLIDSQAVSKNISPVVESAAVPMSGPQSQRFWLKAPAPWYMPIMFVTLDVVQSFSGWLKEEAPENM